MPLSRRDAQLQREVQLEVNWVPSLMQEQLEVVVQRGVVTLSGTVSSVEKLREAERAVRKVPGVKRIAERVELRPGTGAERRDDDLRRRAIEALRRNLRQPVRSVTVRVADGWITVAGEVEDRYQRDAAAVALASLVGAAGVTSKLTVRPTPDVRDIQRQIADALRRRAEREAEAIKITAFGGKVILEGSVGTVGERLLIENAALDTRGVSQVELQIRITHDLPPLPPPGSGFPYAAPVIRLPY